MRRRFVETGRDRRDLAAEAGYGRLSLSSVLAGVLVGAGTFGLLAVSAIAVAHRVGWDGELMDTPRGELALGGGLVMAGLLLVSFLYGGYVSGRMARRAGLTHGVATFVLAVGGTIAAVAIVTSLNSVDLVARTLHRADLPVTRNDWRSNTGLVIAVAGAAAAFVGCLLGAIRGDRWHARLVTRAATTGPEAAADRDTLADRLGGIGEDRRDVDRRDEEFRLAAGEPGPAVRGGRTSLEEERELARREGGDATA